MVMVIIMSNFLKSVYLLPFMYGSLLSLFQGVLVRHRYNSDIPRCHWPGCMLQLMTKSKEPRVEMCCFALRFNLSFL